MSQSIEQLKEQLSAMSVTRHGWSPRRAGSRVENEAFAAAIGADQEYTGTYKRVIDENMEEWKSLMTTWAYADWYWKQNSFPYVYKGVRLFHRDRRKEIIEELTKCHTALKEKGAALDKKRDAIIQWAKTKFPTTFDESVYPKSWGQVFGVTWSEHNMDPPKYLERDDAEEYKRELQRGLANIGASMSQFERDCMHRMSQVAYSLSQNLGSQGNSGLTQNVKGMMELFDRVHQMRFEGTAAFQKAVKEVKALIEGVEVDEIKRPGGIREDVKKRLDEIIARNKKLKEEVIARSKENKEKSNG